MCSDTTFFAPYFFKIVSSPGTSGIGSSIAVGDDDDERLRPAAGGDEPLPDFGRRTAAADDHERPLLDDRLGRLRGRERRLRGTVRGGPAQLNDVEQRPGLVCLRDRLAVPFAGKTVATIVLRR